MPYRYEYRGRDYAVQHSHDPCIHICTCRIDMNTGVVTMLYGIFGICQQIIQHLPDAPGIGLNIGHRVIQMQFKLYSCLQSGILGLMFGTIKFYYSMK